MNILIDDYQVPSYLVRMKLYSVTEVADALKVSRQAIFDRINRGTLKAERIGNQFVITERELKRVKSEKERA
ncbi:MAG TPA: helix-turn-helix domain-containing protein [Candidatus Omnitrophota bacterium]|nr:helix-turn-helix domain-containing protein [Candidatus Omnitrophota bacterium]